MGFFSKLFSRSSPAPLAGELTPNQGVAQTGIGVGQVPGLVQPTQGTYHFYRRMSAHPTLALARSIVSAPILAAGWAYEVRRPDGRAYRRPRGGVANANDPIDAHLAERAAFVQNVMDPLRPAFLAEAMRALEFGWRPFEKIWDVSGGRFVLRRLKPLLPDFTWINIDPHGGFAGLTQMDVQLGPEKSFIYTHDGEAGNLYGRSRHENAREVWSKWGSTDDRAAQLATKAAAIIPMVHYPLGQSRDASGQVRDNGELADVILNGLGSGKGVKLPNLFASTDDPRLSADLAGQSAWIISFLESANAASNLGGLTDRQRYYDALMFRAWLRPERTGLESIHGSRADATTHTDTSLTDSELIHSEVCAQLTRCVIDELLELNFGPAARGSVYLTPAPLQGAKRDLLAQLFAAVWKDPAALRQFIEQTDMDAVFDLMEVPKANEQVMFGGVTLHRS